MQNEPRSANPGAGVEPPPETLAPSTGGLAPRMISDAEQKELDETPELGRQPSTLKYSPLQYRVFKDHEGNECISIWYDRVKKDDAYIPPPWNYQVYVTFGKTASPENENVPWCNQFYDQILRSAADYLFVGLRLDFLFLPNASPSTCVRHYRAEKHYRASMNLALVPSYVTEGLDAFDCKDLNAMLILSHEDIKEQGLKFLTFDPEQNGDLEPTAEIPEWMDNAPSRFRLYEEPNTWTKSPVVENLQQLYIYGKGRREWEREFAAAKESKNP